MTALGAVTRVDFSRDIQPLLAENCYHCHGPDEKARKGSLRLDTKEGAFRVKDGKSSILPGRASESDLIKRLVTQDPDDRMPPAKSNRVLSPAQIDLFKRWVNEGAAWGQHWAFVPPAPTPLPAVRNRGWVRDDLDRFVLANLERQGLKPTPEADRATYIRRVTLDLTGLPPTPGEIDRFLADRSSKAYEVLVDRLLSSHACAERLATEWLDLARYADTHGFQSDRYRAMWPWRDWVIRSFERNQRYDEFVTWQLAGDLLPNATQEQRLATAFNRLHLQNEEGGIVEEEFRIAAVVDRVNTFGTAFLGITFECARCHNHKYDPFTQKDFYSLSAFFNNIDEFGQTSYFTDAMSVPALNLTDPATETRLDALQGRIRMLEQSAPGLRTQAGPAFESWLKSRPAAPEVLPGRVAWFGFDEFKENRSPNSGDASKPAEGRDDPKLTEGHGGVGHALLLNGDNGVGMKGVGAFSRNDPFSLSLWIRPAAVAPREVVVHRSQAANDAGSRGYEVILENGRVSVGLHHMWPRNSLKVTTRTIVGAGEWTHIACTYDGSSRAAGLNVYLNGESVEVEVVRDGLSRDITYERADPELEVGFRFRDSGFRGGRVDDLGIFQRALTRLEVSELAGRGGLRRAFDSAATGRELSGSERDGLLDFFVATAYPPARVLAENLQRARRERGQLVQSTPEIMVMEEMAGRRPTHVLRRGAYDAPTDEVGPGTPASLPPFPKDAPRNRLGLSRWLTAPENPLMGRVTVNRAWQMMFGRGLVETTDNLGTQGAVPSHPELLDHLARTFVAGGWNYKGLLRHLVLSSTYRQSSRAEASLLARDPENRLLARGPVKRLTAEMLRDQALFVSGLLVEKVGGPSVKPYQPEGIWEEKAMGAPRYDQGHGDDLYRRSLYTYWKRTVPHPAMVVFDAAERNTCVVRRQSTSTPLQALNLLNDTQCVEAARHLGQRMLTHPASTPEPMVERLGWMFRSVIGRQPTARETAILARLFEEQRRIFEQDPAAGARLLAVGESPGDPGLAVSELAAATVTAQAVFNHDGAIMRR